MYDTGNQGLRMVTSMAGGRVASFAANGDFNVDSPGIGGKRFIVKEGGNVGIGTTAPLYKLT